MIKEKTPTNAELKKRIYKRRVLTFGTKENGNLMNAKAKEDKRLNFYNRKKA